MTVPYTGSFATINETIDGGLISGIVLYDVGRSDIESWTQGCYQIVLAPQQPTLQEEWLIQAWTISLDLYQKPTAHATPGQFGRLGKLIGGLIPNAAGVSQPSGGFVFPIDKMPSATMHDVIWDGTTDPPPPTYSSLTAGAYTFPPNPLIHTYAPPTVLALEPGQNVAMALFLTPSLTYNTDLIVCNATYTVYFETQPSPGVIASR